VAFVEIVDEERYIEYGKRAAAAVEESGGEVIAGGRALALLENGDETSRSVVVRFENLDAARKFYESVEYQSARKLREGAAIVRMVVLEERNS